MENKICQNCKKDFIIEPDDFSFYEKMKVPPPTFCPWCRFIRRMCWRNERALYKRNCDLCKKNTISMYPADTIFPVYCRNCWYSDKWEASELDYDFSKNFFEQLKELQDKIPRFALWQRNAVNCDYSNMVGESRNVYLSASIVLGSENVFYSRSVDSSFNIFDTLNIKYSESCYENIYGIRNYNSQYLNLSRNCIDSYFLIDCANCSNCFMSNNLRNKQFFIRNKQYTKEEYFKEIEKINLGSRKIRKELVDEFKKLYPNALCRFANIINCHDSNGDNLLNAKNCLKCFDVYDAEELKYCYRAFKSKDSMDYDFGYDSEFMYEYLTGAKNDYNVRFSSSAIDQIRDAEYIDSCVNCTSIFGCIGIKNKENVILNKVYPKEEYKKLRERIIKHINETPYIDKRGIVYKYGEFFPFFLSPFAYNETYAYEFSVLTKEEAITQGYKWREPEEKNFKITIPAQDIPDNIKDVKDEILNEVLGCGKCGAAFKITQGELQFYRKHNIPLPDQCPNCRYYERFSQVPLPKLYKRTCMKCKKVEFQTPYAPDRPEIVYCESCYNKEVY